MIFITDVNRLFGSSHHAAAISSSAAGLIERALAYIREHAADGITVDDVVDQSNVSRCLLYLRFREQLGKSVLAAITEQRIAMMKAKLKSSNAPVAQLALASGFPTAKHATRVFKAATGISPRDWRAKQTLPNCPRRSARMRELHKNQTSAR